MGKNIGVGQLQIIAMDVLLAHMQKHKARKFVEKYYTALEQDLFRCLQNYRNIAGRGAEEALRARLTSDSFCGRI